MAIIHDIINDVSVDILDITETWMQQDAPDAVKLDRAPPGYNVVHAHRKSDVAKRGGGGLAVVYRDNIRVIGPINIGVSFAEFELLVITVRCSQRSVDNVTVSSQCISDYSLVACTIKMRCKNQTKPVTVIGISRILT